MCPSRTAAAVAKIANEKAVTSLGRKPLLESGVRIAR